MGVLGVYRRFYFYPERVSLPDLICVSTVSNSKEISNYLVLEGLKKAQAFCQQQEKSEIK